MIPFKEAKVHVQAAHRAYQTLTGQSMSLVELTRKVGESLKAREDWVAVSWTALATARALHTGSESSLGEQLFRTGLALIGAARTAHEKGETLADQPGILEIFDNFEVELTKLYTAGPVDGKRA